MTSTQLDQLSLLAMQATLDAGKEILQVYNNEETLVDYKGDNSPLTQADTLAHLAIVKLLDTSGIPVLSEEGKHLPFEDRKHWTTLWIVDPLDGTKEFIKRNGEFTVNIALVQEGSPILGVVYVPVSGELYLGIKGQGALKLKRARRRAFRSVAPADGGTTGRRTCCSDRPLDVVIERVRIVDGGALVERKVAERG